METSTQITNYSFKEIVNGYLELAKVKITIAVTITTFVGYILAAHSIHIKMMLPLLGLFLLACGSAALNHYQEKDLDSIMNRTKNRPIPSGKISGKNTLIFSLFLVAVGCYLLYTTINLLAVYLGLLALLWYNVIYTYLKRTTAFAVIPGAFIGAIPPMIGYLAGGGNILAQEILGFAFFIFIWQIPHFWLLLLMYGQEYESAGFPTLTQVFQMNQIKRITYIWLIATALLGLSLPLYTNSSTILTYIGMLSAALWLIISSTPLVKPETSPIIHDKAFFKSYFMKINFYALIVMTILSLDQTLLNSH